MEAGEALAGRAANDTRAARKKRRPWWRKPLQRVASVVGPRLLRLGLTVLGWTLRVDLVDSGGLLAHWRSGAQAIVAFWHDRLLVMPLVARDAPVCILVSHHRDGEIATRALGAFGVHTVRGSATRGAVGGFLRLVEAFRQGYNLAVIPDGPRGPRYAVKPGVIRLAKATGAPIYPVSYTTSRAVRLRSWDRLLIPLPFARVTVRIGEPLAVSRDAKGEELEERRRSLEESLAALAGDAETFRAA
jgi:lysophospholipid acyltransferase (LPLAT)-like uncharacterized protein